MVSLFSRCPRLSHIPRQCLCDRSVSPSSLSIVYSVFKERFLMSNIDRENLIRSLKIPDESRTWETIGLKLRCEVVRNLLKEN